MFIIFFCLSGTLFFAYLFYRDLYSFTVRSDKQAIGVYYEQIRIGWVPRTMNTIISRLMDAGKAFFCRITTLNEKDPDNPWKDIECKIFMVE